MNPPLCGSKVEHDRRLEFHWRCHVCDRIRQDRDARGAEEALVEMLADAVVERLKEVKK